MGPAGIDQYLLSGFLDDVAADYSPYDQVEIADNRQEDSNARLDDSRIGTEDGQRFYGHSFITDEWGDFQSEVGAEETGALVATLDLAKAAMHRAGMGFFRDRRPELYGRLAQDI